MRRNVLIIANRHSRRGSTHLGAVLERLRADGLEPEVHELPRKRPLEQLIRERGNKADVIVLGGGDGTMNAASSALLEAARPFAILPLGTANDLARTLGIPQDPVAAAELILAGPTRRIDLGVVNDRHFFNVASIGLSVRVAKALTKEVKRRLGSWGYPLTVYRVLKEGHSFSAEIRGAAGSISLRSIQLAVGNGRFYGGGLVVDEAAAIDDHTLHLYSLKPQPMWKLLSRALAFRQGRHDDPEAVEALAGARFEVLTKRPMPVNTDGEVTTSTPARFSVLPAALEVVAPAPA
jgi:diacylglycerol kinase (ATP)